MQTVAKVPFNELRVGDRVKSMITGVEGVITDLIDTSKARRKDDNEIVVKWDNGNISLQWHFNFMFVWLM